MLHIQPISHGFTHFLPFAQIFPDALFAGLDKLFHAVGFDSLFPFQSQTFFNFQFNRQTMGIPACNTKNIFPLHGVITRDKIFHRPGEDMTYVRLAVSCGRAVIKGKAISALMLPEAFAHDVMFFPKKSNLLLPLEKLHVR